MRLIQKAIIKRGDKFLIILRAPESHSYPEYWDFPGGKLEQGETPFEGINREIFEETSLKARILKVVGVYEFDFGNDGKSTHRFTIYSTEIISGEVKLSHEHTDFKWVTKDEILKMKIEPFMIEYFKQNS